MKEAYQLTKEELAEQYGSLSGHTGNEAEQLLQICGENKIEDSNRKGLIIIFGIII